MNPFNVCEMIVKNRYGVNSLRSMYSLRQAFKVGRKESFSHIFQQQGIFFLLLLLLKIIFGKLQLIKLALLYHNLFTPINPLAFAVICLVMIHWLTRPEYLSHIKMLID